jgi:predicted nucleic acid-binding protein
VASLSSAVFDTNVLVRFYVDEADDAGAWMDRFAARQLRVLVPDLIYAESAVR